MKWGNIMNMICKRCNKEYENEFMFCPKCGNKLVNKNGINRFSELGEGYKNVYGYWKVTTEGDCEGRSIKELGNYEGYIDDIALMLKGQCYYSLHFTNIKKDKYNVKNGVKGKVNVTLDINSNTWNFSREDRVRTMKELFKDRDVEISDGNCYASFVISR